MPDDMSSIINSVETYSHGRLQLIVGLCEKIGVKAVFDKYLTKSTGRPPSIPPGIEALILIAGICVDEGYRPLYAIKDYYEDKDMEGIFHYPIQLSELTDDRFGSFLDDFFDAGCRQIFREISSLAFFTYNIAIRTINYDTTSKVMWGAYEYTDEKGKIGYLEIDFGYSKQKRNDKKQIKIGLGTANGVVSDAKVLSGNMDDKTYNKETLDDVDKLLSEMNVDRDEFYYIADSALFTAANISKANENKIKYITRMPDNFNVAKAFLDSPLPEDAKELVFENKQHKKVNYKYIDAEAEYEGHALKLAVVYSSALENSKRKTCLRYAEKERTQLEKKQSKHEKIRFNDEATALLELDSIKQDYTKLKYHTVEIKVITYEKNRPGRPNNQPELNVPIIEYGYKVEIILDEPRVEEFIRRGCTFILCSNDLSATGEKLLTEYKTQSDVEKRFQALKSPKYMNSLFLKLPQRIEALVYLLLICLMMLTVAERVVRDKLKENQDHVLGIDRRKIKQPTFNIILQIMDRVRHATYTYERKTVREIRKIDESAKKIIGFLGLEMSCFAWNDSS